MRRAEHAHDLELRAHYNEILNVTVAHFVSTNWGSTLREAPATIMEHELDLKRLHALQMWRLALLQVFM